MCRVRKKYYEGTEITGGHIFVKYQTTIVDFRYNFISDEWRTIETGM